jgi:hypothetical protein
MPRILLFFSGSCSKTEVSKQLYYMAAAFICTTKTLPNNIVSKKKAIRDTCPETDILWILP